MTSEKSEEAGRMWIVVHMVQSRQKAQTVKEALEGEGFLVKLNPVYKNTPEQDNFYELMLPASEAEEARQVMMERGWLC